MINDPLTLNETSEAEAKAITEEEFFERALFEDVLEMKSLEQVSNATAVSLQKLRDETYDSLFRLYQKTRGIQTEKDLRDDVFAVFELFFKNYYQHFRMKVEDLITERSPVQVAYMLGRKSERLNQLLDQFIKEVEADLS